MKKVEYRNVPKTRERQEGIKTQRTRIKQKIYMIISLIITIFIVSQVYFLVRYTLGYEVKGGQLIIYKWINKVESNKTENTYTNTTEKNK